MSVSVERGIVVRIDGQTLALSEESARDLHARLGAILGEPMAETVEPPKPSIAPKATSDKAVELHRRYRETHPDLTEGQVVSRITQALRISAEETRRLLIESGVDVAPPGSAGRRKGEKAPPGTVTGPKRQEATLADRIAARYREGLESGLAPGTAVLRCQRGLRSRAQGSIPADEVRRTLREAGIDVPEPQNRGGRRRATGTFERPETIEGRADSVEMRWGEVGPQDRSVLSTPSRRDRPEAPPLGIPATPPPPAEPEARRGLPPTPYRPHEAPKPEPSTHGRTRTSFPTLTDDLERKFHRVWAKVSRSVEFQVAKWSRGASREDREDRVEEARLCLWANIETIHDDKGVVAYASRLAANVCERHARRQRAQKRAASMVPDEYERGGGGSVGSHVEDAADPALGALEGLLEDEDADRLRAAMAHLSDRHQEVLRLRAEGLTIRAIGTRVGVSQARAQVLVEQATGRMRELVGEEPQ